MLENKQREEFGLADEIAEQRRGVTAGVVKVPVTVIERWEEIARKLEGPAAYGRRDTEAAESAVP